MCVDDTYIQAGNRSTHGRMVTSDAADAPPTGGSASQEYMYYYYYFALYFFIMVDGGGYARYVSLLISYIAPLSLLLAFLYASKIVNDA